ncbi:MAG: FMN-dependent NADH-azoreductase [Parvularcula sp.]
MFKRFFKPRNRKTSGPMPYILRIDASARTEGSHSRRLADLIEQHLLKQLSGHRVQRRDLAKDALPHIDDETIAGFYTPKSTMPPHLQQATALSDALIEELRGSQALIISVPMYNFSLPSSLKAWIDQIVRINETFSYDGASFNGLVPIRRAYLAISYGSQGYAEGGALAGMNFLEPYLNALLPFLGIEETKTFRIEGTTGEEVVVEEEMGRLRSEIDAHFLENSGQ